MFQEGNDVGNERWPFEPSEGADGDASGLGIAAAGAGSNHSEVARRRRTAILRFEHGEARDWRLRQHGGHKGYKGHKRKCRAE